MDLDFLFVMIKKVLILICFLYLSFCVVNCLKLTAALGPSRPFLQQISNVKNKIPRLQVSCCTRLLAVYFRPKLGREYEAKCSKPGLKLEGIRMRHGNSTRVTLNKRLSACSLPSTAL